MQGQLCINIIVKCILVFFSVDRFYVNDVDNEVVSRDILLLEIISSINPDDLSDIEFLWDVWYNMTLTEGHCARLKVTLERLLSGSFSSQWKFGDAATKKRVMMTWKSWLETEPWNVETMKKKRQDLYEFNCNVHNMPAADTQSMPIEPFCKNAGMKHMESEHLAEWNIVHRTGIAHDFVSSSIDNEEVINPTMMRPGSSRWHVHYGSNPIAAYLPFER